LIKYDLVNYIEIPSDPHYIDYFISKVIDALNKAAMEIEALRFVKKEKQSLTGDVGFFGFGINLSIDEAIRNAFIHGNRRNPAKKIRIVYSISPSKLEVSVEDEGRGFNYKNVFERRADPADVEGGRGLLLIRNFMDRVFFNSSGNKITMIKYREKKTEENLL